MKAKINIISIISIIVFNLISSSLEIRTAEGINLKSPTYSYDLEVDGARFHLIFPEEIDPFISSEPDELLQMASSYNPYDFLEISIIVIPASSDQLLKREFRDVSTTDRDFIDILQDFRNDKGATQLPGHKIRIFEESVDGISNKVMLNISSEALIPVVINEWVVVSSGRVWIFRISQSFKSYFEEFLSYSVIEIVADDITQDSLSLDLLSILKEAPEGQSVIEQQQFTSDLPTPSWWSGDCNVNNHTGSYPLGGIYRGVKACGPINTEVLVYFGVGNRQYEWQCPELSKRYLYLAFGTPPYSAHGKDVVWNYPGTDLEKITNGTPNKGPNAGDVLSYGSTTLYGHTSVVTSSNIDANGNGTITVMEQNSTLTGTKNHSVLNWVVQASMAVSGWLYIPITQDLKIFFPLILK